jgi:hypothetical protein
MISFRLHYQVCVAFQVYSSYVFHLCGTKLHVLCLAVSWERRILRFTLFQISNCSSAHVPFAKSRTPRSDTRIFCTIPEVSTNHDLLWFRFYSIFFSREKNKKFNDTTVLYFSSRRLYYCTSENVCVVNTLMCRHFAFPAL